MKRSAFALAGVAAFGSLRFSASATGGLDPEATPYPTTSPLPNRGDTSVRVLLAANTLQLPQSRAVDSFVLNGKTYRGTAAAVDLGGGKSGVVATVGLDAYLYGVVPLEAGRGWPAAALSAQAILARTYALGHRSLGRAYDLVAHEGDQVWGSRESESADCTAAVDASSGQVLTYGAGAASVFYGSCCGGHTADATALWGRSDLPYLRGVADPACVGAPDYRWNQTLSAAAFLTPLSAKTNGIGTLRSLALREPQADGRRALSIVGTTGTVDISASEVRRLVGARVVRSSLWRSLVVLGDLAQAGTTIVIEGSGRGHGVGLCQWGARNLALAGKSTREILTTYFPGTDIAHG